MKIIYFKPIGKKIYGMSFVNHHNLYQSNNNENIIYVGGYGNIILRVLILWSALSLAM